MLTFSYHNTKLNKLARHYGMKLSQVVGFDLPAGYTCPAASLCKSYANPVTRKLVDASGSKFRCYAASGEVCFTAVREMRWRNFNALHGKNTRQMYKAIVKALPENVKIVRVHSSGDFFSKEYFQAWCEVAKNNPDIMFFGYTKILPYVKESKSISNFRLVYSHGGKMDSMVTDEPVAYVIKNTKQANFLSVPVACINNPADDYEKIINGESFALLIHGTQPAA